MIIKLYVQVCNGYVTKPGDISDKGVIAVIIMSKKYVNLLNHYNFVDISTKIQKWICCYGIRVSGPLSVSKITRDHIW